MGTGDWNDGLDEIGSQGRGESVWLGFFLYYILERMTGIVARKGGRTGRNTTSAAFSRSKQRSRKRGEETAICVPTTTTVRRSASRGVASGRSTR